MATELISDRKWHSGPTMNYSVFYDAERPNIYSGQVRVRFYVKCRSLYSNAYYYYPIYFKDSISGVQRTITANFGSGKKEVTLDTGWIYFDNWGNNVGVNCTIYCGNKTSHSRTDSGTIWYTGYTAPRAPGRPGNQLINGKTSETVSERSDTFRLSWTRPDAGTHGIAGYRVFCSRGNGWQKIGETADTYFDTDINSIQGTVYGGVMPRGHAVGFYIQAFNTTYDSGYANGVFDYNSLTLANVSGSCSSSEKTCTSAKISWNSNINVKTVEYRKSSSDKWVTVQSGLNTKSSSFTITGLTFNTKYTVEVRVTAVSDSTQAIFSTTVTTLDIAKITAVTKEWSVEATGEITATNPGGCALQLYLDYYTNNTWVPLISRPKIELVDGKYTLTLTRDEINILYKQASGKSDARFRFTLKSYYPNYLGEHSMETKITFPTKAWVKPEGTTEWKRALVWARDSATSPWKQVSPWVDPTNNKNWKRI